MSTEVQGESIDGSSPRRPRDRSSLRPEGKSNRPKGGPKIKISFSLGEPTAERLGIHAAMTRRDKSEIVGELIDAHLKSYRVQKLNSNEPLTEASEAGKRVPNG